MGEDLYEVTFKFLHPGYAVDGYASYTFQVYTTVEARAIVESTRLLGQAYPGLDPREATDVKVKVYK